MMSAALYITAVVFGALCLEAVALGQSAIHQILAAVYALTATVAAATGRIIALLDRK